MRTRSDNSLLLTAVFALMAPVAAVMAPVAAVMTPVAAVMVATPAAAQTGPEILRQMLDRQRERLSGIESLLIEQEMMGIETTVYMTKEMVDGEPTLVPVTTNFGGMSVPLGGAEFLNAWTGGASQVYGQWAERFSLDGTDLIDGRSAYRLTVDDFAGMDLSLPSDQDAPVTPLSGVFHVDQTDLVMLRLEMEMEATTDTGENPVVTLVLDDYREVEGYLHPFHVSVSFGELMNMAVDGVDLAEVARQLDELEERLDQVPPAQRGFVERMLLPLREMLAGAPLEIVVTRLQVNVDPPRVR